MLPFETDIQVGIVTKNFLTVMPKVVPDQRAKFDNDELFRKLSRESEIRYTGFRDRPPEERQLRFQTECREGHADVAFVQSGFNLHLTFTTNSWSERDEDRVPTQDFVDFEREPGKVHLKSQFILNGVCVVWKGWIDIQRLDGVGSVEYDEERANQPSSVRISGNYTDLIFNCLNNPDRKCEKKQFSECAVNLHLYCDIMWAMPGFSKPKPVLEITIMYLYFVVCYLFQFGPVLNFVFYEMVNANSKIEDTLYRQQINQYNRQLRDFEDRQRHNREEQERRAQAEAEGYHRLLRSRVSMLEKSHPLFLLGLDRPKRSLGAVSQALSTGEPDKKRAKKTETTVQVPVPVKPVVASTSLDRITGSFALAASAGLHRPLLNISHTVTSDILTNGRAATNTVVSRSPIVTRSSLLANCPVKLYPWKPNMYIV